MANLNTFTFEGSAVRTIIQNGEPWFVASDVAKTLGYTNVRDAVIRHCKGSRETRLPSAGGEQTVNIIREGDVFRLILRSKLPAAQAFESWVMDEVLPAIRKRGRYGDDGSNELFRLRMDINSLKQMLESRAKKIAPSEENILTMQAAEASLLGTHRLIEEAIWKLRHTFMFAGVKPLPSTNLALIRKENELFG